MSLSTAEATYQATLDLTMDLGLSTSWKEEEDIFAFPALAVVSSFSHDFHDDIFPSDEAILEAMTSLEQAWEDMHHRS